MKSKFGFVLWGSYVLTMAASIGHLAWTFGTLEPAGLEWAGWLPALAVDAGLAALAYAIQQRKRAGRSAWSLWLGVAVFAGISAYANTLHALSVAPAELGKALVLSAVLPLLVVYLGEIISADDAAAAQKAADEAAAARRQAEREAERALKLAQAEAARAAAALAEAERAQAAQPAAQSEPPAPVSAALCEFCEIEFATVNARNAHLRHCAARKVALSAAPANGVAH